MKIITIEESEAIVKKAYNLLLGRDPEPEGMRNWTDKIRDGLSEDDLYLSFFHGSEFARRLNELGVIDNLRWETIKNLNADITIPLAHIKSKLILPSRDESVVQGIVDCNGIYEPHITSFITSTLEQGDTFIDIGANIGYFTVLGSRCVGDAGSVISFEPVSRIRHYLNTNISINDLKNVRVYDCALWNKEETVEIIIPDTFLGGSHLLVKDYEIGEKEIINCKTLDRIIGENEVSISSIKLMKIDIEGAEPFALDGMINTIKKYKPTLVLEVNRHCLRTFFELDSEAIWNRLKNLGYSISAFVDPAKKEGQPIEDVGQLNAHCDENSPIDIVAIPD